MRVSLSIMALFAAGCQQDLLFEHVSTLVHSTDGLVVHQGGELATAGMGDQVCTVRAIGDETQLGVIVDYDFTMGQEAVQDQFEETVLVSSTEGVHLIESYSAAYPFEWLDIQADNVQQARLTDDQMVLLRQTTDGCQLDTMTFDGDLNIALDDALCMGSVDVSVNPIDGSIALANGKLTMVDADGPRQLDLRADLVAFDPLSGDLFVGDTRDGAIKRVHQDKVDWEVAMANLVDLNIYGEGGQILFARNTDSGYGEFGVIGDDGRVVDAQVIPNAGAVTSSSDGETVAVSLDEETHFFAVTPDGTRSWRLEPWQDEGVNFVD
ncbi:MAG: hypothetical protein AAFV53_16945 [Myxococcota bacterium]